MYDVFKNKCEATPYQYVTYLKIFEIGMTMTYEMIKEDSGRVEKEKTGAERQRWYYENKIVLNN